MCLWVSLALMYTFTSDVKSMCQVALEEFDAVTDFSYQSNTTYPEREWRQSEKFHHLKFLLGLEKFLYEKVIFVNSCIYIYIPITATSYFSIHSFFFFRKHLLRTYWIHTTHQNGEFYKHSWKGLYTLKKEMYSPKLNFLNALRIIESMIGVKEEKNLVDTEEILRIYT